MSNFWCEQIGITHYVDGHNKTVNSAAAALDESPIYPVAPIILGYTFLTKVIDIDRFYSNVAERRRIILSDPENYLTIKIGIILPSIHHYDQIDPGVWIKVRRSHYGFDCECKINAIMAAVIDGDYAGFDQDIDIILSHNNNCVDIETKYRYKNEMLKNMRNVTTEWLTGC